MNLNQITLPVKNIKKAVSFYKKLGLELIVNSAHYARFYCQEGDSTFSLMLDTQNYINGAVIYFECKKLDQRVEELAQKGIVIEQLPRDEPYLWREAVLFDPSGNKIKLYFAGSNRVNPPWRI